jgi:hypothetical protein
MMANAKISPLHWHMIVQGFARRQCVPFLGAGVNVASGSSPGLPLGRELATKLLARLTGLQDFDPSLLDVRILVTELLAMLGKDPATDPRLLDLLANLQARNGNLDNMYKALDERKDLLQLRLADLARVALHMRIDGDVPALWDSIRQLLDEKHLTPSPLLSSLAQLNAPLIVTTNYDGLMERALEGAGQPYFRLVQSRTGFVGSDWTRVTDDLASTTDPILYKLHGSFSDPVCSDGPAELIITEEDYIDFLPVLSKQNEGGVPNQIKQLMTTGTLLFLGYGLEDWDFRMIFRSLVESLPADSRRTSFAIQKDPSDFWVKFWDKKNVTIYDIDLYDFADQLDTEYRNYQAAKGA